METSILIVGALVYLATRKPPPPPPAPIPVMPDPLARIGDAIADRVPDALDRAFAWFDKINEKAPSTPPGIT